MWIVMRVIGSKLLSDGSRILHPGTWMTYYLMCNMAFLIMGYLYAWWRVVTSFLVTLLFGAAKLDRNLLTVWKVLDGPHHTFVAATKLEQVWQDQQLKEEEKDGEGGQQQQQQQQQQQDNQQQEEAGVTSSSSMRRRSSRAAAGGRAGAVERES
jgi:hypothetical protein